MNSLKTVLFPATVIHSIRQYPIFLLFSQINIISAVESHEKESPEESTDTFINSGLCQVDTPCPLGENLDRFLHLVTDIRTRKDDYAAQLSSLTLAAMSSSQNSGEESERAIINEFITPRDVSAEEKQQAHEAKLWQARLVLAIGEILDRDEEEIARNLSMVDDDTSGLFNALRGDNEDFEQDSPFAELSQLTGNFSAIHSGNMGKRLDSWTQLFTESKHTDSNVFLTTSADVLDTITESYEKATGNSPIEYTGIELPGLIGWTEKEAVTATQSFKQDNSQLILELTNILTILLAGENYPQNTWSDMTAKWKNQLEETFPEGTWGRLKVSVTVFTGCSINELLGVGDTDRPSKNGMVVVVE
ncbi:MAG: hypothetical protein ACI8PB_004466 [Desulforhopalus sp.]|jgi:hypothetical protein